jgi:hypothetical protein
MLGIGQRAFEAPLFVQSSYVQIGSLNRSTVGPSPSSTRIAARRAPGSASRGLGLRRRCAEGPGAPERQAEDAEAKDGRREPGEDAEERN